MTYLAAAIAADDTEHALATMQEVAGMADLAELRLDLMNSFDLARLLVERPLPVIVTCRPRREGGQWWGTETARLDILRQATSLGADYVDLEWDAAAAADDLDRRHTKVILSRHSIEDTPNDLTPVAHELWAAGADIVKVVGTAHSLLDTIPVFELLEAASAPTIGIAMGTCGLATRLMAFRYVNSFLSFASPDPPTARPTGQPAGTAPGQITLGAMRRTYRVQAMTASTSLVGLAGHHVNDSPLAIQVNDWLAKSGRDAVLIPLELGPKDTLTQVVDGLANPLALAGFLLVGDEVGDLQVVVSATGEGRRVANAAAGLDFLLANTEG